MTKNEREEREYKSLFCDERYAKKAWRQIIGSSLQSEGKALPILFDKDNRQIQLSVVDEMAFNNVKERLMAEGKTRDPMQAELIVESNIIRARFTDTTFNTILDRTAGKVKDEISFSSGQYEDLSDEELAILMKHRADKVATKSEDNE